jgi:hypothetical protein
MVAVPCSVHAAGLPPELAQGLFAKAGVHGAILRMSTNAGDILPDSIAAFGGPTVPLLRAIQLMALARNHPLFVPEPLVRLLLVLQQSVQVLFRLVQSGSQGTRLWRPPFGIGAVRWDGRDSGGHRLSRA